MLDPSAHAPYSVVFALPEALAEALNKLARDGRIPMSIFKLDKPPSMADIEILGADPQTVGDAARLGDSEVFCVVTMPVPQQPPPGIMLPGAENPFRN